ncbi:phosphate signaling complex protein PhoU [Phytoactinopolyspora halotolerans]|uniref:Phosphate-specific transport system accessory protein PhoU n=1 Tax=Phytoactinopolyspora halotolerans TaxID=1981512 RepID=A0A6L9S1J4_9ACTN|nr:phosphate signaling complex protein PhoU [Phytoactinopolyspora halotolerans]NED98876.1 phosphate signaling complex protein PhoU [Phytoactinopolyspora halotolerans]
MRDAYREQLDAVTGRLVGMIRKAGEQMHLATRALLDADLEQAEKVVGGDAPINRDQLEIDELTIELMATQGPVASELRMVTAALRTTADIERMGDLAVHIAKIARMRYPDHAVPAELRETFAAMGKTAEEMAQKAGEVLRTHDLTSAAELSRDDNEMDRLHRSLFLVLLDDAWDRGVEPAVDIALLGRYYERFADHAVEIAGHVRYLVTGEIQSA